MERSGVSELQYIAAVENVPSILRRGILSHDTACDLPHLSLADEGVQSLRSSKQVPGGERLHRYANLYFNARNPMLYRLVRTRPPQSLVVLRIDAAVLDTAGAVITDYNAAKSYAGFWPSPAGLAKVNVLLTYAHFWTHPDPAIEDRNAAATQAELLIPNRVPPAMIQGFYVANSKGQAAVESVQSSLAPRVDATLFFEDRRRDSG